MKPVLLYSDIFVFVFLALLLVLFLWGRRREDYREAAGRVLKNKWALLCTLVIVLYGCVAFLDSLHFKKALRTENGAVQKDQKGEISYGEMWSVLDAFMVEFYPGIREEKGQIDISFEKSYSAPFASKTFDMIQDEKTGDWHRENLKIPGGHFWGTGKAGGDVFYKLVKGIRTALIVGLATTLIVIPFAIVFGVTAGYFGGFVDDVIQFIYITLGSIPGILLISAMMIIVQAKVKTGTADAATIYLQEDKVVLFLCAILGLAGWSGLCRLLRGETIKIRELDYVQAARSLGASHASIIVKHIIPNVIHVVLISSILRFSGLVMVEAILAYIKIGVPKTIHSWGRVVDGAREQLGRDPVIWWPVLGAFIMMFLLVLSINVFGDAVRDALDPKLRTGTNA
ncbi:MAG: ABC transporter permease [Candidatus Brocadiia bacterium]